VGALNDRDAAAPAVLYAAREGVATITLNRPKVHNAINAQVRAELPGMVEAANADPDIRVIVLRGAGDRAFCAGADVTEFQPVTSLPEARERREREAWNDVLAASAKPTVAAIRGYCLGGGLEMAIACDLRIAAEGSTFGFPEVGLGVIPGTGGTQRLPRLIGVAAALRMVLTAERLDASEALTLGLISEIVPVAGFEARVDELSASLASHGPLAMQYAKKAILQGSDLPLAAGLRMERDLATLLTNTEDRLEGTRAFRDRRRPRFVGR
jgi:enoyl-CoA hydratase